MTNSPIHAAYPKIRQGTSLVDRMNVFIRFRKYFKLIGQRWWILLLGGAIGFGFASYQAKNTPARFKAVSRMGVTGRIQLSNNPQTWEEERASYFENQLDFMRSAEVHGQIRERMGKPQPPGFSATPSRGSGSTFIMEVVCTEFNYA